MTTRRPRVLHASPPRLRWMTHPPVGTRAEREDNAPDPDSIAASASATNPRKRGGSAVAGPGFPIGNGLVFQAEDVLAS